MRTTVCERLGIDLPIVLAPMGGAVGPDLAAALALGAGAGWIGTRFLASEEARVHPLYRERLLESPETGTVHLMNLFDGGWPEAPHRALRNSTVAGWEAAGCPAPGERPGEGEVIAASPGHGEIARYRCLTPGPDVTGDVEACALWAGQTAGLVRRVQPAAGIVRDIMDEARAVIAALPR